MKKYIVLFFSMLKIGLFTFGGGYAMISLLDNEFVSKKKWIEQKEFADMIAIAESTPGPLAVNSATYIGYRIGKVWGALIATVAVCIPSFVIIFIISLFFDAFSQFEYVGYAFKGIQMCVVFLILSTGIKLLVQLKKCVINYVIFAATAICMVLFSIFSINFSTIFYILISGGAGIIIYLIKYFRQRTKNIEDKKNDLS